MKSNSLIQFFLAALMFLCALQFSTVIPTYFVEQEVKEMASTYASQFAEKEQSRIEQDYFLNHIDSISQDVVFSIPGVAAYSYADLKERQLQLGLDLNGGMQFIIELDQEMDKSENSIDLLKQTKMILDQRLNHLGFGQTNITIDNGRQQLHVEVPVATNPERLRSLIMKEAKLEFWNTYRVTDSEIIESLIKADKVL